MVKRNLNVIFFGPLPLPITGQAIAFNEVIENSSFNKFIVNTTYFGEKKLLNTLYSIFKFCSILISNKLDVVYFTCSRTRFGFVKDFIVISLSNAYKLKIINHLHGADFNNFYINSGILKPLVKYAYNKVQNTIILTDSMRDQLKAFSGMNLFVVENCYSKIFETSQTINKSELNILYFSNIMMSKGIMDVLHSAEEVLKKFNKINYLIVGSFMGDYLCSEKEIKVLFESKLLKLKKHFGNDSITYLGSLSGMDKINIYRKSSIFILPTYYKTEAFPITIIEAMKTGNAIISTYHNYIPEIVKKKNGILINKNSVEDLINAQIKLIENPALLKNIQEYNVQYSTCIYSPKRYISQIEKIILQI